MKRIPFVIAGFLAGAVLALQVPSVAQSPASGDGAATRSITVTGIATVRAKPDEAVVSLGVHTEAEKAQEAMEQNAAKMNQVFAALEDLGIGDADLATSYISLNPMWTSDGREVTGFQADNTVDVTIHEMGKVGKVIDAAVDAGANIANGITFRLSDANAGVNEALAKAVENARTKADAMAEAADATVGEVLTIAEAPCPGRCPTTASGPPTTWRARRRR